MQKQRTVHTGSLVLGAGLVVLGYLLGSVSEPHSVQAQTVTDEGMSPFLIKRTTLITSSDDGTTLHFWSQAPAGTDKPTDSRGFHYQGSRSK